MDNSKTLVIMGAGKTLVTDRILEDSKVSHPNLNIRTAVAGLALISSKSELDCILRKVQRVPSLVEPRAAEPSNRAQWKDETDWRGRRR